MKTNSAGFQTISCRRGKYGDLTWMVVIRLSSPWNVGGSSCLVAVMGWPKWEQYEKWRGALVNSGDP